MSKDNIIIKDNLGHDIELSELESRVFDLVGVLDFLDNQEDYYDFVECLNSYLHPDLEPVLKNLTMSLVKYFLANKEKDE